MIDVLFERTDERTVHLHVSSGDVLTGEVVFRFDGPGQGRYCEVHDKLERCDAACTYEGVSMTYLPNDPTKRVYRAVLTEPDVFVHYEEVRGRSAALYAALLDLACISASTGASTRIGLVT